MSVRTAWLIALATLCSCSAARGVALYDNTLNDTGEVGVLSGNVWADDLHMTSGGLVSNVQYGYVAGGSALARICFYDNDATNSIWPGNGATLLYSQMFPIDPQSSGLGILLIDPPLALPQHVWYSIQFSNFNGAAPLFDPPIDGTSNDVLVRGDGSFWTGSAPQNYFGEGLNNFQVRIGLEIPSPGAMSLLGGTLVGLGMRRRR